MIILVFASNNKKLIISNYFRSLAMVSLSLKDYRNTYLLVEVVSMVGP